MPIDASLNALRKADPRNQPDFDDSIERYDALRVRITLTAPPIPRRRVKASQRRRLIGLSAIAATTLGAAGVVIALNMTAASTPSAYAAAKRALGATAAATSGTMTQTVTHNGTTTTVDTTQWNGSNLSMTSLRGLGANRQLEVIEGTVYVQAADGTWLHYASAADAGPKLGPSLQLAYNNVPANDSNQILALAAGLQPTTEPDGSVLYTGTIPNSDADPAVATTDDSVMEMITSLRSGNEPGAPGGTHGDMQLQLAVGTDGLVHQLSLSFQQQHSGTPTGDGSYTWTVIYSQLGTTPRIGVPATSAEVASAAVPNAPARTTPGPYGP